MPRTTELYGFDPHKDAKDQIAAARARDRRIMRAAIAPADASVYLRAKISRAKTRRAKIPVTLPALRFTEKP